VKQPKGDEPLTANMMVKATSTVEAITGDAAWLDRRTTAFDDARKESPEVKKKKMNNRHEEERE